MTKFSRISLDDASWRHFVAEHPEANVFHLPVWSSVIAECYGFDAFALVLKDGGEILAGMPVIATRTPFGARRWSSLPFTDSCPLLRREEVAPDVVAAALREHSSSAPVSELVVRDTLPASPCVYPIQRGYRHYISLPTNPEDLHPGKSHRGNRNRAARSGVTVSLGFEPADVRTYYRLHVLTRQRHGVPVQPSRFFDLIAEKLIGEGHGFVASAHFEGQIVASALYLSYNRVLIAKFGASDPRFRETLAGYLADWEVLKWACEEGYRLFDWGRTDLGAEGLRMYKLGWGGSEEPLVYTHISQTAPKAETLHAGSISEAVIRNSPLWVCRALGELLYRWTA
ncbi:MAG: lipid II:glycine glycyltransferase FemX [Coriobacteriia bacterium]